MVKGAIKQHLRVSTPPIGSSAHRATGASQDVDPPSWLGPEHQLYDSYKWLSVLYEPFDSELGGIIFRFWKMLRQVLVTTTSVISEEFRDGLVIRI